MNNTLDAAVAHELEAALTDDPTSEAATRLRAISDEWDEAIRLLLREIETSEIHVYGQG